jgi:ketosteroid isomerase-like protein
MHESAMQPNDLEKLFVQRTNAGDLAGLLALYETNAVLAVATGEVAIGTHRIREFLVKYLADHPQLDPSDQAPALCSGDLALTSTRLRTGDVTAEIARRQPDGSWLWVIDHLNLSAGQPFRCSS